ncbi:MAG: helix-hairpin-helix domain-containing protein [Bacilli bacterium]
MERKQGGLGRNKEMKIVSISLFCFMLLAIGIYFYFDFKTNKAEVLETDKVVIKEPTISKPIKDQEPETPILGWMIDIKGQINKPGTYAVDDSMRVIDIILLAGGLLDNADTSVLNLSQKVTDQMVIIIYSKEEVKHFKETKEKEVLVNKQCLTSQIVVNGACIDKEVGVIPPKLELISINQATKDELLTLPGIGLIKAEAIIKYREESKGFKTLDELMEVPGIGASVFAAIKDFIKL